MRKIITTTGVTLDGFIAGPNGEMDWIGEIYDEAMGKYEDDLVSSMRQSNDQANTDVAHHGNQGADTHD